MVGYKIKQLLPLAGWEINLTFDEGSRSILPLAAMALIERVDDHGDWYEEIVGVFPRPDGSGFSTIYDFSSIKDFELLQADGWKPVKMD